MASRSAFRASCLCAFESFSEIGIFENGTRSGGSNIPRRNRATKSRCDRAVDLGFRDVAGLDLVNESSIFGAAGEVRTGFDCCHSRCAERGSVFMTPEDVAHGAAIAHDVALESPLFPQALLKKVRAGAAGYPVYGVIHAHDRIRFALHDCGPERRQIRIDLVRLAHPGVKDVPLRLWTAVHGVVLGCGDDFQVVRIVPLHARNKRDAHTAGEIGIFSVGFLAAPPAGIAEDIDVRRPVGQPGDGATRRTAHSRWAVQAPGRIMASFYLARASVEIVSATRCNRPVSQVAASPMACGKTVARPWATPCSASFHQL